MEGLKLTSDFGLRFFVDEFARVLCSEKTAQPSIICGGSGADTVTVFSASLPRVSHHAVDADMSAEIPYWSAFFSQSLISICSRMDGS